MALFRVPCAGVWISTPPESLVQPPKFENGLGTCGSGLGTPSLRCRRVVLVWFVDFRLKSAPTLQEQQPAGGRPKKRDTTTPWQGVDSVEMDPWRFFGA